MNLFPDEGKGDEGDDKYLLQNCASKNGLNRLLDVFDGNTTALVRVEMGTSYMDTNIQTIHLPIHQLYFFTFNVQNIFFAMVKYKIGE